MCENDVMAKIFVPKTDVVIMQFNSEWNFSGADHVVLS